MVTFGWLLPISLASSIVLGRWQKSCTKWYVSSHFTSKLAKLPVDLEQKQFCRIVSRSLFPGTKELFKKFVAALKLSKCIFSFSSKFVQTIFCAFRNFKRGAIWLARASFMMTIHFNFYSFDFKFWPEDRGVLREREREREEQFCYRFLSAENKSDVFTKKVVRTSSRTWLDATRPPWGET